MRTAVASSIGVYQRYLSPRKGFTCAHNHLHGRGSCSQFGRRVVLKYGVLRFFRLLLLRFTACRDAAITLSAETPKEEHDKDVCLPGYCAADAAANAVCCMLPF